ncbi:MAG TPA: helix-turn-helix domain-containing protein [Chloroflexota bacterium]|nr:helix-turn-helix domain-containing protein [Chloroflexota bacterium]
MANLEANEFLSAREACAMLGVKPATLYAYVSRGLLASFRQGIRRERLYRRADVEKLLELRPSIAPAPRLPRAEDWIPFVN